MEKIQFDSGVQEFMLGNGVLRFNPSDPNLYGRFLEAGEKIADIQNNLIREAEDYMMNDKVWCEEPRKISTGPLADAEIFDRSKG